MTEHFVPGARSGLSRYPVPIPACRLGEYVAEQNFPISLPSSMTGAPARGTPRSSSLTPVSFFLMPSAFCLTKAAFDIYAPVSGEITAVNADVVKDPSLVNAEAFGKGWLFKLKASAPDEAAKLMTEAAYEEFLKAEAAHGSH